MHCFKLFFISSILFCFHASASNCILIKARLNSSKGIFFASAIYKDAVAKLNKLDINTYSLEIKKADFIYSQNILNIVREMHIEDYTKGKDLFFLKIDDEIDIISEPLVKSNDDCVIYKFKNFDTSFYTEFHVAIKYCNEDDFTSVKILEIMSVSIDNEELDTIEEFKCVV